MERATGLTVEITDGTLTMLSRKKKDGYWRVIFLYQYSIKFGNFSHFLEEEANQIFPNAEAVHLLDDGTDIYQGVIFSESALDQTFEFASFWSGVQKKFDQIVKNANHRNMVNDYHHSEDSSYAWRVTKPFSTP